MFNPANPSGIPPDKFMEQLIVQALQAFYIKDYDTGIYFLNQIRNNLPRFLHQLRPSLRNLCKDIVKIIQAGSLVPERHSAAQPSVGPSSQPVSDPFATSTSKPSPPAGVPTDFISELTSAVTSHKEKKRKKVEEELTGSIDDLVELDD